MTFSLDRLDAPACRACGSTDAAVVRRGTRWGQPWTRRRCRHCGTAWSQNDPRPAGPPPGVTAENGGEDPTAETGEGRSTTAETGEDGHLAVAYHVVRCPACAGDRTRVTSTRRPVRHHKCKDCGHTFKSVER